MRMREVFLSQASELKAKSYFSEISGTSYSCSYHEVTSTIESVDTCVRNNSSNNLEGQSWKSDP